MLSVGAPDGYNIHVTFGQTHQEPQNGLDIPLDDNQDVANFQYLAGVLYVLGSSAKVNKLSCVPVTQRPPCLKQGDKRMRRFFDALANCA